MELENKLKIKKKRKQKTEQRSYQKEKRKLSRDLIGHSLGVTDWMGLHIMKSPIQCNGRASDSDSAS